MKLHFFTNITELRTPLTLILLSQKTLLTRVEPQSDAGKGRAGGA